MRRLLTQSDVGGLREKLLVSVALLHAGGVEVAGGRDDVLVLVQVGCALKLHKGKVEGALTLDVSHEVGFTEGVTNGLREQAESLPTEGVLG